MRVGYPGQESQGRVENSPGRGTNSEFNPDPQTIPKPSTALEPKKSKPYREQESNNPREPKLEGLQT
ncbi:MAG: hypothetical protein QF464_05815 [Myxococcota bacterium]|nr:hypothetical protein [Myxococcota bacterium]